MKKLLSVLVILGVFAWMGQALAAGSVVSRAYLPLVMRNGPPPTPSPTPSPPTPTPIPQGSGLLRRVNAPHFPGSTIPFEQTAIFWFGSLSPTSNYVDVRAAYSDQDFYLYVAIFDRRLWYDDTPPVADLTTWDAITLYLDLDGNTGNALDAHSYRITAGLADPNLPRGNYERTSQGAGGTWGDTPLTGLITHPGWRGQHLNDNTDDRGWAMTFRIPYTALGLSGPPLEGTTWGLGLVVHDRDDSGGTAIPNQTWPQTLNPSRPKTWGQFHFGLYTYTPPQNAPVGSVKIREEPGNGIIVPDAAMGSTTGGPLCSGDPNYIWNTWPNRNFGSEHQFNIQNQSNIDDWPCFAKYYVTFPLDRVPQGKVILSATLTLYQWSNNGPPDLAPDSYIHVLTVPEAWNESSITWNNAPWPGENIAQIWVPVVNCKDSNGNMQWPCFPRTWDVTGAAAQAYAAGQPLRLALYASDSGMHSGKLFTTSETGDWNVAGRPALDIVWGNP
ncbi:MAG: DNRLRE domain-containing protein [Anaerolineales bacterium]